MFAKMFFICTSHQKGLITNTLSVIYKDFVFGNNGLFTFIFYFTRPFWVSNFKSSMKPGSASDCHIKTRLSKPFEQNKQTKIINRLRNTREIS